MPQNKDCKPYKSHEWWSDRLEEKLEHEPVPLGSLAGSVFAWALFIVVILLFILLPSCKSAQCVTTVADNTSIEQASVAVNEDCISITQLAWSVDMADMRLTADSVTTRRGDTLYNPCLNLNLTKPQLQDASLGLTALHISKDTTAISSSRTSNEQTTASDPGNASGKSWLRWVLTALAIALIVAYLYCCHKYQMPFLRWLAKKLFL